MLAPAVTRLLRERWLASSNKNAEHLVFCKTNGRGRGNRAAGEAFRAAVKAAGTDHQMHYAKVDADHRFGPCAPRAF